MKILRSALLVVAGIFTGLAISQPFLSEENNITSSIALVAICLAIIVPVKHRF